MDAQQLWQTSLGQLELQLARDVFDTWLANTRAVSSEDGLLVVSAETAYAKDWIENRLYGLIQGVVSEIAQRTLRVRFIVQRNSPVALNDQAALLAPDRDDAADRREGMSRLHASASDATNTGVMSRYTFDSFIIGLSNRLACAGCVAVAEDPGNAYNPLFLYGGVGLGKTHLLHAIGNRAIRDGRKVLYVAAEGFANELINAIRVRNTEDFRAKYRSLDVLLLDDAQFLINKERTQEEFFHTFNDLYQEGRQIVLSSDRPPTAFGGMEERLRSRFGWGLTVDVQAPDYETRVAILQTKAHERNVAMPDDVLSFIAEQVQSNIRELEGALTRVLAWARMMEYPLTVQTAQHALGEYRRQPKKVTLSRILDQVASYFDLSVDDLTGPRRPRSIAVPRQIAMYLARDLTSMSLPQIGDGLGGRDHTTILHGCNKISALFEKDDALRHQVLDIKSALYNGNRRDTVPEFQAEVHEHSASQTASTPMGVNAKRVRAKTAS